MSRPDTLTHLTLNTGHTRASPRAEVGDAAIAAVAPLVRSGGGPLPDPFGAYHLTVVRGEAPGGAAFTVQRGEGGPPLVTCFVCWRQAASRPLWDEVIDEVLEEIGPLAATFPAGTMPTELPPRPLRAPWLAALLWPTAAADPAALGWLGDFERVLAWALIEQERA